MASLRIVSLLCLGVLSLGAKDQCTCTYTGYAGDKCGNNPSVSVALPTAAEGDCLSISGFEASYFDIEGLSFAGQSVASTVCSSASSDNSTVVSNATTTTNDTSTTNSTSNVTANTSSVADTCPGAAAAIVYGSFKVVSCQGNQAEVQIFPGSSCSGAGISIPLVKGKCTNLIEVSSLGWISYQLKCNRGGGNDAAANNGVKFGFSWTMILGTVLMLLHASY